MGGGVLAAAARKMGRSAEIDEALILAEREDRWPRGREVFDRIRLRSLSREHPLAEERSLYFRLAELVAKLAHNAAGGDHLLIMIRVGASVRLLIASQQRWTIRSFAST